MLTHYHLTRNNCQTFCKRLFSQIRIPTRKEEVSTGLEDIPAQFRYGIVKRRRADLVWFKILEAKSQIPSFQQTPLAIESAIDTSLAVLICAVLLSARKQLEQRIWVLFSVTLCLLYFHGNHRALHILMSTPRTTEMSQKELEKIIEWLCPHNGTEVEGITSEDEWTGLLDQFKELGEEDLLEQLLKSAKRGLWPFKAAGFP
jgi:hypothetical protein